MTGGETKAQKAFALNNSRDMLQKLGWELNNLFFRQRRDFEGTAYRAFNCAVTAWHLTDWIWQDLSSEAKKRLGFADLVAFQKAAREECEAIRLCYQLATGSKHCLMERRADSGVSADIDYDHKGEFAHPIIVTGSERKNAETTFHEAKIWFECFMQRWVLEEPFIPNDDSPVSGDYIPLKSAAPSFDRFVQLLKEVEASEGVDGFLEDLDAVFSGRRTSQDALEEFGALLAAREGIAAVLQKFGHWRAGASAKLVELYKELLAGGAGQRIGDTYVATAALYTPELLMRLLQMETEDAGNVAMALEAIKYFERQELQKANR